MFLHSAMKLKGVPLPCPHTTHTPPFLPQSLPPPPLPRAPGDSPSSSRPAHRLKV